MTITITVRAALDGSTWQTPRADMTWTNITPYVQHSTGCSITRGRSTSRDDVRAGSLNLTLLDAERRFDPENTAGDYYGFLNPGVPIWVFCNVGGEDLVWGGEELVWDSEGIEWGATSHSRFFGFIEDWPQGSYNPADRVVEIPIEAFDAFSMLALGRQAGILDNAILDLSPLAYWPMSEADGPSSVTDVVGAYPGELFDEPKFGEPPLAPGLATSVEFDGFDDRIDVSRSPMFASVLASSVVAVVRTSSDAASGSTRPVFIQVNGSPYDATRIQLYIDDDGKACLVGTVHNLGNAWNTEAAVTDGESHLLIGCYGANFGVAIDSATLETNSFVATAVPGNGAAIGGTPNSTRGYTNHYFEGRISNVAVWDGSLNPTKRVAIVEGYQGRSGDTTDERIDYILDRAGFPTADRVLTTGYTTLGPGDHLGEYTLDLIRRIEKTEQGRFFISVDGDATFHARYHGQLVATASEATFSDDGADNPYSQVVINRPRSFVYNKVTVTADGLAPVTVQDAASITAHGERELTIDAPLLPSASTQRSLAEYVLTNSKDPQLRVTGLSVPLHKDFNNLGSAVLPLEQGSRVTSERTPVNAGSSIVAEQIVEGYTEQFDTTQWTWTPNLSPAEPTTFAVWNGASTEHYWNTGLWGY